MPIDLRSRSCGSSYDAMKDTQSRSMTGILPRALKLIPQLPLAYPRASYLQRSQQSKSSRLGLRCSSSVHVVPATEDPFPMAEWQGSLHTGSTGQYRALVLDSTYRPIDIITWQRAVCLDLFDKVDVLEYYDMYVRSAYDQHFIPAVLRVRLYVHRSKKVNITVSKRNVILRDYNTCQYCGTTRNLTIDHITPKSKGGGWEWSNLVAACQKCNGKKGEKSLKQMKWKLKREPREPSPYELGILLGLDLNIQAAPKEWKNYLYMLKQKSKSTADEELTDELSAMTNSEDAINVIEP